MFYRVTKYNFDDERYDEILAWGESVRAKIEGIEGMLHVDIYRSAPGEGMIVAAYASEDAFTAASETVSSVLGDMAQFMTGAPHTHSGTVEMSFGR
jgi:heme-degrading monooxygenase HmoA